MQRDYDLNIDWSNPPRLGDVCDRCTKLGRLCHHSTRLVGLCSRLLRLAVLPLGQIDPTLLPLVSYIFVRLGRLIFALHGHGLDPAPPHGATKPPPSGRVAPASRVVSSGALFHLPSCCCSPVSPHVRLCGPGLLR